MQQQLLDEAARLSFERDMAAYTQQKETYEKQLQKQIEAVSARLSLA